MDDRECGESSRKARDGGRRTNKGTWMSLGVFVREVFEASVKQPSICTNTMYGPGKWLLKASEETQRKGRGCLMWAWLRKWAIETRP